MNKDSLCPQPPLALWCGRAVQPTPEKRRAVFEPFGKTQDRLREFARRRTCPEQGRRSRRTAQGTRRATPRPTWFWLLFLHTTVSLFETNQTIGAPFGTHQATSSFAGAKPGIINNHLNIPLGSTEKTCSTYQRFLNRKN
jgi:hypothetical protein